MYELIKKEIVYPYLPLLKDREYSPIPELKIWGIIGDNKISIYNVDEQLMFDIPYENATDIDAWAFTVYKGQVYTALLNGIDNSIKLYKAQYPIERVLKGQKSMQWSLDEKGDLILISPFEDFITIYKNLQ